MTRMWVSVLILGVLLTSCSTVTIKSQDGTGSGISGSMMNGSLSYSSGEACQPAQPNPATPIPASTPALMTPKRVCQDGQCVTLMAPADVQPKCYTQIATVRGTDSTTYFGWLFAALGAAALAVSSGT